MRPQFLVVVLVLLCATARADLTVRDQTFLLCVDNIVEAAKKKETPTPTEELVTKAYDECYQKEVVQGEAESDEDFDTRERSILGDLDFIRYLLRLEVYFKAHETQLIILHGNEDAMEIKGTMFPVSKHMDDIWYPQEEGAVVPFAKYGWLAIQDANVPGDTMRVSTHVRSSASDQERADAIWKLPKIAFDSGASKLKMVVPWHRRTDSIVISFPVQGKDETERKAIFDTFVTNLEIGGMNDWLEGGDMLPPFQFRSDNDLVCASDYTSGASFGKTLVRHMVTQHGNPDRIKNWQAQNQPVANQWNFGAPAIGLEEQLHKLEDDLSNWM